MEMSAEKIQANGTYLDMNRNGDEFSCYLVSCYCILWQWEEEGEEEEEEGEEGKKRKKMMASFLSQVSPFCCAQKPLQPHAASYSKSLSFPKTKSHSITAVHTDQYVTQDFMSAVPINHMWTH